MLNNANLDDEQKKTLETLQQIGQRQDNLRNVIQGGEKFHKGTNVPVGEDVTRGQVPEVQNIPQEIKAPELNRDINGNVISIIGKGISTKPSEVVKSGKDNSAEFRKYSSQDMFNKLMGLDKEDISKYKSVKELLESPKKEYSYMDFTSDPYAHWGYDKTTNQREKIKEFGKDNLNPNYEPKYIKQPLHEGKFDSRTGKLRIDFGNYDPKLGTFQKSPEDKILISDSQYIPIEKNGKNGEKLYSDEITKIWNTKFKEQQDILAQYNILKKSGGIAVDNNGKPILDQEDGSPITADKLKKRLDAFSEQYAEQVKSTSSEEFLNWYDQMYNVESKNKEGKLLKKKGNPTKKDFWDNLKSGYTKGDLSEKDFVSGINIMRATYQFDPLTYFGE